MLFEEEHYGKPISKKLAHRILKYVTNYDKLEATKGTEVSAIGTINSILYRQRPLTERVSQAIINLARIAFVRCNNERDFADDTMDFFLDELNENEHEIRNHVLNQTKPETLET